MNIIVYIAAVATFVYLHRKWTSYRAAKTLILRHGCKPPPKYPHRDFIWGTDLTKQRMEAVKAGRQMGLFMEHFNNIGKTWEENFFGVRVFNTMDVQNIQQVAALAFDDYGKPAQNFFKPFLGDGVLSLDGLAWKHSRDLVKPIFSRSEVSDVDTLGFHVDRFLDLIPSDGKTIDIQEPLHNLFLDLATEFLFGQSIEAQLPEDPNHSKDFLRAFNGALAGIGGRRLAGKLHPLIYAFDKTWKRDIDQVYSYIDRHIHRALEAEAAGQEEKADPNPSCTTRRYVLLNELVKHIKDPLKLRYQVLNVFMPGRDTTSVLVANCLFHVARNPEIWTQLRKDAIAIGDTPLTFETLKSLHSFRHVLYETLRLQGPAGRVQRLALRDTVLPHGGGHDGKSAVLVRKGDVVALNLWGPNHDKDLWGDDVGEFKPQRFIGRKMGWEFTPFLGGPRICPAQQQVLTQAVYLLVRLTRKFSKIENRDPVLEYVEMVRMTTESRNGVKIALFP
ncbi:Cytochrome P450 protein [Rutstroemia sp. NJR-2017a WRK4]|nr:Cytochrome P450 protein [Rutstroemia sp. NJR-2017a WRK4]